MRDFLSPLEEAIRTRLLPSTSGLVFTSRPLGFVRRGKPFDSTVPVYGSASIVIRELSRHYFPTFEIIPGNMHLHGGFDSISMYSFHYHLLW